jgi:acyl carrier protein
MDKEILNIINRILRKKGKPDLENLEPSLSLRRDLGFDSFDLAELTVRIEDELSIDIFERGLVDTISDILLVLEAKK